MQWIPNDENKRRDEAFADFIGGVAYEEDRGWSKEVWDAAWSAKREWVSLTDEEIDKIHRTILVENMGVFGHKDLYRSLEALLREKNT